MKVTAPNGFVFFLMTAGIAANASARPDRTIDTTTSPPPPVMIVTPPPPPPMPPAREITNEEVVRMQEAFQQIVTLDVEASGPGERLWLGTLRVNSTQSGDYNATQRQAIDACPADAVAGRRTVTEQNQLNISIGRRSWNRDIDGFTMRASWTRPKRDCSPAGGQRTVSFEQPFSLRAGESIQLAGDAGLVLKITRRR